MNKDYDKNNITIVIPALNEAPTISDIITGCCPYSNDIVVVDGHSSDDTVRLARAQGARAG